MCIIYIMTNPTYAQNKERIYSWRVKNPERNRFINRECMKRKYKWETVAKKFLNILLPDDIPCTICSKCLKFDSILI